MSATATCCPSAANTSAVARPMPDPAPVMRQTLSSRRTFAPHGAGAPNDTVSRSPSARARRPAYYRGHGLLPTRPAMSPSRTMTTTHRRRTGVATPDRQQRNGRDGDRSAAPSRSAASSRPGCAGHPTTRGRRQPGRWVARPRRGGRSGDAVVVSVHSPPLPPLRGRLRPRLPRMLQRPPSCRMPMSGPGRATASSACPRRWPNGAGPNTQCTAPQCCADLSRAARMSRCTSCGAGSASMAAMTTSRPFASTRAGSTSALSRSPSSPPSRIGRPTKTQPGSRRTGVTSSSPPSMPNLRRSSCIGTYGRLLMNRRSCGAVHWVSGTPPRWPWWRACAGAGRPASGRHRRGARRRSPAALRGVRRAGARGGGTGLAASATTRC